MRETRSEWERDDFLWRLRPDDERGREKLHRGKCLPQERARDPRNTKTSKTAKLSCRETARDWERRGTAPFPISEKRPLHEDDANSLYVRLRFEFVRRVNGLLQELSI